MSKYNSSRSEHLRTDAERAVESHTEYAERTLGFKPTTPLASTVPGQQQQPRSAGAGGGANSAAPFAPGPQVGKVVSISRAEVFGTTQTTMRVLMDKGGERTVRVSANEGPVRVAMDIAEGDQVKLNPTGPSQWEWAKVVAVTEKVRKKRKIFGQATLLGDQGLCKLYTHFPDIKWETRPLYESRTLSQIVSMYKEWAFAMWPKMSFPLLVDRIAALGSKALLKEVVTDLRYGKEVDWAQMADDADGSKDGDENDPNTAAGRRKAKQTQLTANAAEIFEAFTGAKQPGIRQSKDAAAAAAAGGAGSGLFDDDDANDDDLNQMMDAIANRGNGGGTAAAAASGLSTGAQLGREAKAALDRQRSAAAAAQEAAHESELERRLQQQMNNNEDDIDPLAAPVNAWTASSSKAAAAAAAAAERAARDAEAAAAEAAMPTRRAGANNAAASKKRRNAHLDDSDDEEAEAPMAPLSNNRAAAAASAEQAEGQMADAAAPAESSGVEGQQAASSSSSSSADAAAVVVQPVSLELDLSLENTTAAQPARAAAETAAVASSAPEGEQQQPEPSQSEQLDTEALAAFLADDDDAPNEAPSQPPQPSQPQQTEEPLAATVPMETGDGVAAAASAEGVTQAPTQLAE